MEMKLSLGISVFSIPGLKNGSLDYAAILEITPDGNWKRNIPNSRTLLHQMEVTNVKE